MIRKFELLISLFVFCILNMNAQTSYYKMVSYGTTGTENTNVNGGQFITFQAGICFETNKDGESVGNGYMRRNAKNQNIYTGSSYWGNNTKFQFSSNKSILKIFAPNGIIYQYMRSTPPAGVSTCSLIKGKSSSNNTQGPVYTGKTIQKPQKCGICYGSGKCSTCNGTGFSTAGHKHICGACGGSGKCGTCAGTGYSGTVLEYVY